MTFSLDKQFFSKFMQKNSRHWETSYGRPCFFFLDNTITSFKCLKLVEFIEDITLYLCSSYDTVLCNLYQKRVTMFTCLLDLVMYIWKSRQNIFPWVAVNFVGNNLLKKLCCCCDIISNHTRNSKNCSWHRCMVIGKLGMVKDQVWQMYYSFDWSAHVETTLFLAK